MEREKRLVKLFLLVSEVLAIQALASTGDILHPLLILSFLGVVTLNILETRLPRRRYTTGILGALLVPVILAIDRLNGFRALEDAAHLILLLHLTIFFLPDATRSRHFRLGSTFAMTSLAASLSPELITGVFLVLYFAAAFVTLLLQFVFEFSANRFKDVARFGYIRGMIFVSIGVLGFLLLTAVIFPLIPRVNVNRFMKTNTLGQLGLSGEVDLQSKADPTQFSNVALRIEVPADEKIKSRLAEEELMKARNLDSFDGRSWYTSASRVYRDFVPSNTSENALTVVVQRSAIDVPALPVFYQSTVLELRSKAALTDPLQRSSGNSFRVPGSSKLRISYRLSLPQTEEASSIPVEEPLASNWNDQTGNSNFDAWLKRYARQIFKTEKNPARSIAMLEKFFKKEGFQYSLEPLLENAPSGFYRLKKFLDEDKKGHCELFATAAALLLRTQGIATRLAAGFRIPETRGNRFIVIRNSDAHVWVEAWDPEKRKWIVYDPTPIEVIPVWKQVYQEAVGFRDDLESYWYRYVVDSAEIEFAKLGSALADAALERPWVWALLALAWVFSFRALYLRRRARLRAYFGTDLRPELLKLARSLERLEACIPESLELGRLRTRYNELRFSKVSNEEDFQRKISQAFDEVREISSF